MTITTITNPTKQGSINVNVLSHAVTKREMSRILYKMEPKEGELVQFDVFELDDTWELIRWFQWKWHSGMHHQGLESAGWRMVN